MKASSARSKAGAHGSLERGSSLTAKRGLDAIVAAALNTSNDMGGDGCESDELPSSSGECTSGRNGQSKQTNAAVTSNGHKKQRTANTERKQQQDEEDETDQSGEGGEHGTGSGGGTGSGSGGGSGGTERGSDKDTTTNLDEKPGGSGKQKPKLPRPEVNEHCPRCASADTKFCYYNNYNVKQPRFFCKDCERYWTSGGTLRNVPPGSGRRKSKSAKDGAEKNGSQMEQMVKQSNFPMPPALSTATAYGGPLDLLRGTDPMLAYNAAQQQFNAASLAALKPSIMPTLPTQWQAAGLGAADLTGTLRNLPQHMAPLATFSPTAALLPSAAATCLDASAAALTVPTTSAPSSAGPLSHGLPASFSKAHPETTEDGSVDARRVKSKLAGTQEQPQSVNAGEGGVSGACVTSPATSALLQGDVSSLTSAHALTDHYSRQAQTQAMQAAWLQQAASSWGQPGSMMGNQAAAAAMAAAAAAAASFGAGGNHLDMLQQQGALAAAAQQQGAFAAAQQHQQQQGLLAMAQQQQQAALAAAQQQQGAFAQQQQGLFAAQQGAFAAHQQQQSALTTAAMQQQQQQGMFGLQQQGAFAAQHHAAFAAQHQAALTAAQQHGTFAAQQQAVAAMAAAQQQQHSNLQQLQAAQQFQAAAACNSQVNPYMFSQLHAAQPTWPFCTLPNTSMLPGSTAAPSPAAALLNQQMTQQLLSTPRPVPTLPSLAPGLGVLPGQAGPGTAMRSWPVGSTPAMQWGVSQPMGMAHTGTMDGGSMNWAGVADGGLGFGQPGMVSGMQQPCAPSSDAAADMSSGNSNMLGKHPRSVEAGFTG